MSWLPSSSRFMYHPHEHGFVREDWTSLQTRLSDFDEESGELRLDEEALKRRPGAGKIWKKAIDDRSEWGVCNLDGTVIFIRLVNGKILTHGFEAVCKWCGSKIEIRGNQIFCVGKCGRYQGTFSTDLNEYLRWEGAKSYTLRKEVARVESLQLEDRDLEPISYAPDWSVLDEYSDEDEPADDETEQTQ